MKTNQTLTRAMGKFSVYQRTIDGMFNARTLVDDFNALYKCNVNYGDFFKEEADFLELMNASQQEDYLPFASFVHFVLWLHHPLAMHAFTLACDDALSISAQEVIRGEQHKSFIDEYFKLKSEAGTRRKDLKIETYLIKDTSSGYIKIGKSTHVLDRFKALRVGNPCIKLIMVINSDVEKTLHDKYESKRVAGEWFNLSDDDLIDISILNKYQPKELAS